MCLRNKKTTYLFKLTIKFHYFHMHTCIHKQLKNFIKFLIIINKYIIKIILKTS